MTMSRDRSPLPSFGGVSLRQAMAAVQRDNINFKVVVRVRPPLKREMPPKGDKDADGLTVKFKPITEISNEASTITLLEYLGQEVTEKGR